MKVVCIDLRGSGSAVLPEEFGQKAGSNNVGEVEVCLFVPMSHTSGSFEQVVSVALHGQNCC